MCDRLDRRSNERPRWLQELRSALDRPVRQATRGQIRSRRHGGGAQVIEGTA